MSEVIYANDNEVASKVMDGEAILINLGTGIYYSLDDVASCIWSAIETGSTVEQIAEQVCAHFDASSGDVFADVSEFTALLQAEGLTRVVEEEARIAPEVNPVVPRADYAAPTLEKFDDMAEMFALDPPLPGLSSSNTD
jgi:hypothetical protein